MRKFGPIMLTVPPRDRSLLDAWTQYAAAEITNQLPKRASIAGPAKILIRAAIDADGRVLADMVPAIVEILAGEEIISAVHLADVAASLDRTIAPGKLSLVIAETTAPSARLDAATRLKVAAAGRRRFAEARASAGAAAA